MARIAGAWPGGDGRRNPRGEGGVSEVRSPERGQRVEVWTDTYRLVGYFYLPQVVGGGTARLSDIINDPQRRFLPLTHVALYRHGDEQPVAQQDFLLVNRDRIELLRPLD